MSQDSFSIFLDHYDAQIQAEVLHYNFIAQLNISFLTADHLAPLHKQMFSDSKIAKIFVAVEQKQQVFWTRQWPHCYVLSLSTTICQKWILFCVYIFDVQWSKQVEMKFSSMCSMSWEDSPKSKIFFDAINNALKNDWLNWENVLSVSLDNTNTNMGEHKSLKSCFHSENLETFIAGCYCDSTHIVASNGGQGYCSATGFECEEYQWTCFTFLKTGIWNLLDQSGKGSYRLDGFH